MWTASRRFREGMGLSDAEVAAFEEYFYHIMASRGSGEHALRHLLGPFARGKHPLEGRLHELRVGTQKQGAQCNDSAWLCMSLAIAVHGGTLSGVLALSCC